MRLVPQRKITLLDLNPTAYSVRFIMFRFIFSHFTESISDLSRAIFQLLKNFTSGKFPFQHFTLMEMKEAFHSSRKQIMRLLIGLKTRTLFLERFTTAML